MTRSAAVDQWGWFDQFFEFSGPLQVRSVAGAKSAARTSSAERRVISSMPPSRGSTRTIRSRRADRRGWRGWFRLDRPPLELGLNQFVERILVAVAKRRRIEAAGAALDNRFGHGDHVRIDVC